MGAAAKRLAPLLLLLPLAGIVGWVAVSGRHRRDDPADVLGALRAAAGPVLPAPPAAVATPTSEPARYDRETLYEFIDGAADAYLAHGFVSCIAGSFAVGGEGARVEVAAEVHRFADEAGARAQLAAETPPAAAPVAGVPGAVAAGEQLLAVRGSDFLKLTALTPGPGAPPALLALAAAWGKETTR